MRVVLACGYMLGRLMEGTTAGVEKDRLVVPVVSRAELIPYALFGGVLLMLVIYFVGSEDGAFSLVGGNHVHDFVHDARHLLGFPCH